MEPSVVSPRALMGHLSTLCKRIIRKSIDWHVRPQVSDVRARLDRLAREGETALERLQVFANQLQSELAQQKALVDQLKSELGHEEASARQLRSELAEQKVSFHQIQFEVTQIQSEVAQIQSEAARQNASVHQLQSDFTDQKASVDQIQPEIARQKGSLHQLELEFAQQKVREIGRSGLFDRAYYLARYPDVALARLDPAAHYVASGATEGRDPHPLFDTSYYLESNPDVAAAGSNPLLHYVTSGVAEGRDPHPWFDTSFYLDHNPDVAAAGVNPLIHYLAQGAAEGRDPHPRFSVRFYGQRYPDVVAMQVNPLLHFLATGAEEPPSATPDGVDPVFCLSWNQNVASGIPSSGPEDHTTGRGVTAKVGDSVRPAAYPRPTLFISHDARRHGAQLFFLNFLRWVRNHEALSFEVCCRGDGELAEQFQALAPTVVCERRPDAIAQLRSRIARGDYGLLYVNTMANGELLAQLQPGCAVMTHLHELECMIRYDVGPRSMELTRMWTDRFVACSQAVRHNLIRQHGVPATDIDLVHEFIPIDSVAIDRARAEAAGMRASLGIPENALIVGGSGTTDWRKGPDLFVQLARLLLHRPLPRPVYFLWVGGDRSGREHGQLSYELSQAGLADRVQFLGEQTNPLSYFALFDVFALVSREDPYPLVVLEAASLGLPILGFQGSGGIAEFVESDCGYCVPYLAVDRMAERLTDLLTREELRHQLGRQAACKVRERHALQTVAPRLAALIRQQHASECNRAGAASARHFHSA